MKIINNILKYFSPKELPSFFRHMNNLLKSVLAKPFMAISNILFFDEKKIVFDHFAGAGYGGNPKHILEELKRQNLDCQYIWLTKSEKKNTLPSCVKAVKKNSWAELFELATSKVWIDDCRKIYYLHKNHNQYYIQTWHGGGPCLKMVENDAKDELTPAYIKCAIHDSKMADLFISDCKWRDCNYRKAFWYTGEILTCGTPSSDLLANISERDLEKTRSELNISREYKVALYAPTFRNSHSLSCYDLDYMKVVKKLEEKFGGKWCLVIRLHPILSDLSNSIEYSNVVINGSLHSQIEDILILSDVLITDFSGCMFEGYRMHKKVFIYASDYDDYVLKERKLYFDITELPAGVAKTNEALSDLIDNFDENLYFHKTDILLSHIGYYPYGNATKKIVYRISSVISKSQE